MMKQIKKEIIPIGQFRSYSPVDGKVLEDVYTTSGGHEFTFNFVPSLNSDHYEIDIISQPDYGDQPDDSHSTHRLPSDRGGMKICFGDDSVVSTLDGAKKWAGTWAELTMKYIEKGEEFPES